MAAGTFLQQVAESIIGRFGLRPTASIPVDANGNFLGSQANPVSGNQVVGTPLVASNTGAAGAAVTATLTGLATDTVYINGFIITTHAPAANQTGQVTVTGVIGGVTMQFTLCESATVGGELIIFFPDPIPASAINTPIVVTLPAIASGAVGSVTAVGYHM